MAKAATAKVLIAKTGRTFYVKDPAKDYHCQFGMIKASELRKKDGSKIKSNTGMEFSVFGAAWIDRYKRIKRDAQIVPLKDIGIIISETGLNKMSVVVDAGSGSGALCCALAKIAKSVTTYEIRDDFIRIVKLNKQELGLTNLTIKKGNICKDVKEKNIDIITLDIPEPWNALSSCKKALKHGGFLVSYSPTIVQNADLVNSLKQHPEFMHIKTIEIIERPWEINERRVRPKSAPIGHSGFMTFLRRV